MGSEMCIRDCVSKTKWDSGKQRGGYIWHTTGSGKTMTSFKSAQLIANSNDADKVVFLTDRIELGTQSLKEYRAFADENETVQATENTYVLISKLKSIATADTLIVTSAIKMFWALTRTRYLLSAIKMCGRLLHWKRQRQLRLQTP